MTKSFTCDEKYSGWRSPRYRLLRIRNRRSLRKILICLVDNTASDYGCACDTKGSSKSPDFDASSSSFQCVSNFSVAISGSVKKDKLNINGIVGDGNRRDRYLRGEPDALLLI